MDITYTAEQQKLREELRSYFAKLMTPERREALMATTGEYGAGNVYREVVQQMGQRRLARPRLAQGVRRPGAVR